MTAVRELRHFLIPTSDTVGWSADDGYPPKWLSVLVKDNLSRWQVADKVSFKLQRQDSSAGGTLRLRVGFMVGSTFRYDTGSEVGLVERCIVQALNVYGGALANPVRLKEYRARADFRQALDQIVLDRSALCLSTKDSMVMSQDVHRWLRRIRALQPGRAYLVRQH